jgi:hypothetical protein
MATSTYSVGESPSQRAYDCQFSVLERGPISCTYNDGDVDVRRLLDCLSVGARVGDDDEAGLLERLGDVVRKVTGSEATGDGDGAGVGSELEDRTLTVGTGRDDADYHCQPMSISTDIPCSASSDYAYCRRGCQWRR